MTGAGNGTAGTGSDTDHNNKDQKNGTSDKNKDRGADTGSDTKKGNQTDKNKK